MDRFLITENNERKIGYSTTITEQYKPVNVDKPFQRQPLDDNRLCAEELRLASNVSDWEFRERYPEEDIKPATLCR